ncbi:MAG: AAA family ATPase [Cellvibrionaceae bacterium]
MSQLASEQLSSDAPLIDPFENYSKGVFFTGGCYQQLLDQLTHFVQFGSDPVVIFGEQGAGKTALCRVLADQAGSPFAFVTASASLDVDALMAQACVQWEVPPPEQRGRAAMVAAIEKYCIEEDLQVLPLCVDDAHVLNSDSAEILLEICSLLPVVPLMFCVEEEAAPVLLDKSVELEITPLSQDELTHYLAYRFDSAGLAGADFDEKEIQQLFEFSGGVPGLVADEARALLVKKHQEKSAVLKGSLPLMHIGVLVVLAVALLFLWLAAPEEKPPVVKKPEVKREMIPKEQVEQAEVSAVSTGPVAIKEPVAIEEVDAFDQQTLKNLQDETQAFEEEAQGAEEVEALREKVPAEVVSKVGEVASQDVDSIGEIIEALNKEQDRGQESLLASDLSFESEISDEVATAILSDKEQEGVVSGGQASENSSRSSDVAWLQRQDDSQYTLQLMGAGEEASLRRLASRYFERPLYILQTTRAGNPWYILVHGAYESNSSARSAIPELPVELKISAPWPKKFAEIKGQLEL